MPILRISDFSGGLNTEFSQNLIKDNESPALRNISHLSVPALTKRRGLGSSITMPNTAVSQAFYRGQTLRQPGGGTAIRTYLIGGNVGTTTNILQSDASVTTFTTLASTSGSVYPPSARSYAVSLRKEDLLYLTTGEEGSFGSTNTLSSINGSGTITNLLTAPKSIFLVYYRGYYFTANLSSNPVSSTDRYYTLRWSALEDITNWPVNNSVDIGVGDAMSITGLIVYNDSILIFINPFPGQDSSTSGSGTYSNSTIYQYWGDSTGISNGNYTVKRFNIPKPISSPFQDSITIWNNDVVFWSIDGLYSFNGNTVSKLTQKIQPTVNNFNLRKQSDTINKWIWYNTIFYRDYLYCSVSEGSRSEATSSGMNAVYVFKPNGTIWRNIISGNNSTTGGFIGQFVIDSSYRLLGIEDNINGTTTQNRVFPLEQSTYADNGGSIDSMYTTKEFDSKRVNHFKHAYVDFRSQPSGILNFEYNIDQKGWVMRQVAMGTRIGSIKRSQRLLIGDVGRTIQFRVSNNEPYVNFEIYEIGCEYNPLAEESQSNVAQAVNVNIGDSTYGQT